MTLLKVKTIYGKVYEYNVSPTATVGQIKAVINTNVPTLNGEHKLVFGTKLLQDSETLNQNGLKDGDTLVVLPTRKPQPAPVDPTPIPTRTTILEATGGKDLASRPMRTTNRPVSLSSQLHDLMTTILGFPSQNAPIQITTSSSIPSLSASTTIPSPSQPQPQPTQPAAPIQVDETSLRTLMDMGFPENRAKKALILNRMNAQLAMEWLLEHSDDPNIDDPLSEAQTNEISRREAAFVPNPEAVQKLKDMGFAEEEIHNALRMTNNNSEAAASWLLGDRDIEPMEDISVMSSVLMNPAVQAGLANPRVRQALKSIMENPSTAAQFLTDPEIGPILLQVHNIINSSG